MFTSFFHPLTTFPTLLSFGIIAPLILRVTLALFLLSKGIARTKKPYSLASVFYFASALLLTLGFYTQIAAILAIIVLKFDFYFDYFISRKLSPVASDIYFLYALAGLIALSLIISGPGLFARDLPL